MKRFAVVIVAEENNGFKIDTYTSLTICSSQTLGEAIKRAEKELTNGHEFAIVV